DTLFFIFDKRGGKKAERGYIALMAVSLEIYRNSLPSEANTAVLERLLTPMIAASRWPIMWRSGYLSHCHAAGWNDDNLPKLRPKPLPLGGGCRAAVFCV